MKDILDNRVKAGLLSYVKGVIDLKYEKDNSPLELKSFDIGLAKFDFDGETLSRENGQYFYTDANGEKIELNELIQFEDINSLVLFFYFQNI